MVLVIIKESDPGWRMSKNEAGEEKYSCCYWNINEEIGEADGWLTASQKLIIPADFGMGLLRHSQEKSLGHSAV